MRVSMMALTGWCVLAACAARPTPVPNTEPPPPPPPGQNENRAAEVPTEVIEQGWAAYEREDYAGAVRIFEPACAQRSTRACAAMGEFYLRGRGVERDLARGERMIREACLAGMAPACRFLGLQYRDGGMLTTNTSLALDFALRSCEGGFERGCVDAADLSEGSAGLPVEQVSAGLGRLQRLCESNTGQARVSPCIATAVVWINGPTSLQNRARARTLSTELCTASVARACTFQGILMAEGHGGPPDERGAVAVYERGCEGGDADSCTNLGSIYYRGTVVARDEQRAIALYRRACEAGSRISCNNLREIERAGASSGGSSASSAPAAGEEPRWSTTMGSSTINGASFSNIRASCGMFDVLAVLGGAGARTRRCANGSVRLQIASGQVTNARNVSNNAGGRCLAQALQRATFGAVTCNVEFTAGR